MRRTPDERPHEMDTTFAWCQSVTFPRKMTTFFRAAPSSGTSIHHPCSVTRTVGKGLFLLLSREHFRNAWLLLHLVLFRSHLLDVKLSCCMLFGAALLCVLRLRTSHLMASCITDLLLQEAPDLQQFEVLAASRSSSSPPQLCVSPQLFVPPLLILALTVLLSSLCCLALSFVPVSCSSSWCCFAAPRASSDAPSRFRLFTCCY